jgi:hypothetical protein
VTADDSPIPGARRGVVSWLAPSPRDAETLWAGTDDGLVRLTRDGGRTWLDVTPPQLDAWSKVATIDASPFDAASAYVAVDRHRLDDDRPYVYVTHDFGRHWRFAASGIPDGSFVNAVRADPERAALLYAATETAVYVSFDDGASWRSLQLNMPVVSVRDISVCNGDLAIATHGRGLWILDDLEPLRELAAAPGAPPRLFRPRDAVRMRTGNDEAEASPPEVPVGENVPSGALIDYVVPSGAQGPLVLTILDARGTIVRRWSSDDPVRAADARSVDYPAFWLRTTRPPAGAPGMHRFAWDLHLHDADGVLAAPGSYTVRLTLDGVTSSTPLRVARDPRVAANDAQLVEQTRLADDVDGLLRRVKRAIASADAARSRPDADVARLDAIVGAPPVEDPRVSVATPATQFTTLRWYASALADLEGAIESADMPPTPDERATWLRLRRETLTLLSQLATTSR